MNFEKIGILIRLRYRLMWAKIRTRNGKIALFLVGYLLLVMTIALFGAGGLGAGMQAVRRGQGALLAGGLLSGVFLQSTIASVILGFGLGAIFSETELRRYPLREWERRVTRHCIGIVDPFWILFLALDLGLALGMYLVGAGSFWMGLIAILLLFVCNYIAARVLGMLVDRLTARKGGSFILLASMMALGLAPSLLQGVIHKNSPLLTMAAHVWQSTPPAAAGVAMTHMDLNGLWSLGVIAIWTAALTVALAAIERRPAKVAVAQSTKVSWEGPIDSFGALFGPKTGPLVAHWLRFYSRNNRFRMIYPLALPLGAFLLVAFTRQGRQFHVGVFPLAIAVFSVLGFVGTGQFAVNQFGYVGGGFRRFLLMPTDPGAAFRAGSYMFVTLSGMLIVPAAILWALFGPMKTTPQALVMLVGCSLTTLFLFHGIALWTSVLGPRRGNFNQSFGNDLSAAGNVAVMGGMLGAIFVPQVLEKVYPAAVSPDLWWFTPLTAVVAIVFYVVSINSTSALFLSRRERLMILLEGKG